MSESILIRWLGGQSIRELAGANKRRPWKAGEEVEHALRVELVALQKRVNAMEEAGEKATNQRNALMESADKVHLLLKIYGEQSAEVALCFGEWADNAFYRGYLCGKGMQATRAQRAFDFMANVICSRASADDKAET